MSKLKGFTLIELLVVIAITALLLTVLIPGFADARKTASKVIYYSNEKHLAAPMFIYVELNHTLNFALGALHTNKVFQGVRSSKDTACNIMAWIVPNQDTNASGIWFGQVEVWHIDSSNFSFVDTYLEKCRGCDKSTIYYFSDVGIGLDWFRSDCQGDNLDLQLVKRHAKAR